MPRVLLITACWPPSTRVGTRRVVRLARRLPALGWTPVVIYPDEAPAYPIVRATDPSLIAPDVEAHCVPAIFPTVRAHRFLRRIAHFPKAQKVADVLFRDSRIPDQFSEWTVAAIRAARRLEPVDCVWITAAPFGVFVPGLAVAKALGVPVVFDYRDPWTPDLPKPNHPFGFPRPLRRLLEAQLLRQAAGAVFVNDDMRTRYRALFGQGGQAHWRVIPNGFDPADAPECAPVVNERPTLLYAGTCYGSRSMKPVLEALAEHFGPGDTGLLLRVFGELDPAAQAFLAEHPLPGRVEINGRILSRDVFAQMLGAHALLLIIGAEHRTALTAKIFDYLIAERPVLGIGPAQASAGALIETCGIGRWTEDTASLVAALREIEAGTLPYAPKLGEIQRYSADRMAEDTAALLDTVIQ